MSTRLDIIRGVCDMTDNSINDTTLKELLNRFSQRAYNILLREESKPLDTIQNDQQELKSYPQNDEWLIFYVTWLYYLNDEDTTNASIYKGEYMGFKLYLPAEEFTPIVDVMGVDCNVS